MNQTEMLLEVLLFAHDTCFFNLECLNIFEFDFSLFTEDLSDNFLEVVVDLGHDLHLALFHLLP